MADWEDEYTAQRQADADAEFMSQEIAAAVHEERESWARIAELARQCAELHAQDDDECGEAARELIALLQPKQNTA